MYYESYWVTEADSIKRVRSETDPLAKRETPPGARPKRLKGMYRAAKRGESWAVRIVSMPTGFNRVLAMCYRNVDWAAEWESSRRFWEKVGKADPWVGGVIEMPG